MKKTLGRARALHPAAEYTLPVPPSLSISLSSMELEYSSAPQSYKKPQLLLSDPSPYIVSSGGAEIVMSSITSFCPGSVDTLTNSITQTIEIDTAAETQKKALDTAKQTDTVSARKLTRSSYGQVVLKWSIRRKPKELEKKAKFVGTKWQLGVKHAQFRDNSYFLFIGGKNRETAAATCEREDSVWEEDLSHQREWQRRRVKGARVWETNCKNDSSV